jgi:hypothetical protein
MVSIGFQPLPASEHRPKIYETSILLQPCVVSSCPQPWCFRCDHYAEDVPSFRRRDCDIDRFGKAADDWIGPIEPTATAL